MSFLSFKCILYKKRFLLSFLRNILQPFLFHFWRHLIWFQLFPGILGNTPFMAAVSNRSYPAALVLFDAAQKVSKESSNDLETQKKTLMSMVYPPGSPPDDSPLHVICCNDTCSFTWTGDEHINQVQFFSNFSCMFLNPNIFFLWTMSGRMKYRAAIWSFLKHSPMVFHSAWHGRFQF